MNAFVESSRKEREILEHLFRKNDVTEYMFTDEKGHERYDAEFTKGDRTFVVEFKNRAVKSDAFTTTLIEQSKVNYLLDKAKRENKVPLLMIAFTDNKYLQFDLRRVKESYKGTRACNKTTAVRTDKVDKSVYLIPIRECRVRAIYEESK